MVAVGNQGVAVVPATLDQVELVAPLGSHLDLPEAALRIEINAQGVAQAERPDLCGHPALVGEGIVGGHAAVVVEAQQLAHVGLHVLGGVELLPVAGADPQVAIGPEQQAVGVMALAADLRHLAPDHLQAGQGGLPIPGLQPRARHRRAGGTAVTGLGVAEVHQPVLFKTGMHRDIAQAALAAVGDLRHPGYRGGVALAVDQLQVAGLLGDQDRPVGEEGQRPGLLEHRDLCGDERAVGDVDWLRRRRAVAVSAAAGGQHGQAGSRQQVAGQAGDWGHLGSARRGRSLER